MTKQEEEHVAAAESRYAQASVNFTRAIVEKEKAAKHCSVCFTDKEKAEDDLLVLLRGMTK